MIMLRLSLGTAPATRAKKPVTRLVRVPGAAQGPANKGTTANSVAHMVKEHAAHRVALFYRSAWKAPVAHVHAASTPDVNGQVPFLVLEGDMLRMPHSNTETSSAEEEKRLKLALLPFDPPLCFCVANRAREPTAWDNAQATPFHNYRIDRPGAFVLVDGALRPMDEAILFSGEEHPE